MSDLQNVFQFVQQVSKMVEGWESVAGLLFAKQSYSCDIHASLGRTKQIIIWRQLPTDLVHSSYCLNMQVCVLVAHFLSLKSSLIELRNIVKLKVRVNKGSFGLKTL